jgi:predicted transcriptional regulator
VQRLVSCRSTDSIDHVRDLMNDNHIRHLPVIDDYTLIGVISMRDINSSAGFGLIARPGQRPAEIVFA